MRHELVDLRVGYRGEQWDASEREPTPNLSVRTEEGVKPRAIEVEELAPVGDDFDGSTADVVVDERLLAEARTGAEPR